MEWTLHIKFYLSLYSLPNLHIMLRFFKIYSYFFFFDNK